LKNARPDRSKWVHLFRLQACRLRAWLFWRVKCTWFVYDGFVRLPWSVSLWSPHYHIRLGHNVQFGPGSIVRFHVEIGNCVLIARNVAFVGRVSPERGVDVMLRVVRKTGDYCSTRDNARWHGYPDTSSGALRETGYLVIGSSQALSVVGIVKDMIVDAISRAAEYSWEKKAKVINGVYERALGSYRRAESG